MAAGSTYSQIASTTLGSAQASYTFSSIPSTYTNLRLVAQLGSSTLDNASIRFNSDTATNYSRTWIEGNGSSAVSNRNTNLNLYPIAYSGNDLNNISFTDIMNYSNTTTYKTQIQRWGNTSYVVASVGLWRSTAAINSITILNQNGYNLIAGSTFTLYGIKGA